MMDVFHVAVDYHRSFQDMIKAGNYYSVQPKINEKNFPVRFPCRVTEYDVVMGLLGQFPTTKEVLQELTKRQLPLQSKVQELDFAIGYFQGCYACDIAESIANANLRIRSATCFELLAFAAAFPEQNKAVALGQTSDVYMGGEAHWGEACSPIPDVVCLRQEKHPVHKKDCTDHIFCNCFLYEEACFRVLKAYPVTSMWRSRETAFLVVIEKGG